MNKLRENTFIRNCYKNIPEKYGSVLNGINILSVVILIPLKNFIDKCNIAKVKCY